MRRKRKQRIELAPLVQAAIITGLFQLAGILIQKLF